MYIRVKKRKDIIEIGDSFMNLDNVTDDLITGTVNYKVNQVNLIQDIQNAGSIVRVTFSTKNPKKDDPIKNINPQKNPQLVPKIVATLYRDSVEYAKNLEKANVLQLHVDSTSKVNNQIISAVKSNRVDVFDAVQMRSTQYKLSTVKEINDSGLSAPMLQTTSLQKDDATNFDAKTSLKKMLVTERKDPSQVVNQSIPKLNSRESLYGVFVKKSSNSFVLDQLYKNITRTADIDNRSTDQLEEQKKVLVIQSVLNNVVNVSKGFSLKLENIKNSDGTLKVLFVFFEVLDRFGVVQQQTERVVELSKSIEIFQTPKIPPTINVFKNDGGVFGSLRIRQEDPQAKFINLYKKAVSHSSSEVEDYFYADQFELTKAEGEKIIIVDVPIGSTIIYRAVPVSSTGMEGSEFTNIVMTSRATDRRLKHASLSYKITNNGIELEVRELSPEAVSFDIVRKDKSIYDKNYTIITSSPVFIDGTQLQYQVVDSNPKKKHVYEYAVALHFRDGRKKIVGSIIVEYIPSADSVVDTKIANLNVTFSPDPNVTFDLETIVISTDVDTLTKLLSQSNLLDFFSIDVFKERSKLNDLICYEIQRQDLTSGTIESFGIVSDKTFDDEKLRVVNSVSPLKAGRQYRYVVTTLLRSPETLFEEFVKEGVDATTRKRYTYKPFKFFQPITLERGSLTTAKTLKLNHSQEPFAFGNVGSFVSTEVSFDKTAYNITDVKAETVFDDFIVVRWKYDGDLSDIDHFLVMREVQGMRDVVGKSHALSGNRAFQCLKKMSEDDNGELEFIVVPIFSDYQIGNEAKSNRLVVLR